MRHLPTAVILALGILSMPASAAELQPGQWNFKVGTPYGEVPVDYCLKKGDAADPTAMLAEAQATQMKCVFSDKKTEGDVFKFRMRCAGGHDEAGQLVLKGNSFEGHGDATAQGTEARITYRGKRTGDCAS